MEDLFQSGLVLPPRLTLANEGAVGGEEHPLLHVVVHGRVDLGILHLGEEEHLHLVTSPDVGEIPLRVVLQVIAYGNPDGSLATLQGDDFNYPSIGRVVHSPSSNFRRLPQQWFCPSPHQLRHLIN